MTRFVMCQVAWSGNFVNLKILIYKKYKSDEDINKMKSQTLELYFC